jgi:DNA-binding SARP family transcriptional activator
VQVRNNFHVTLHRVRRALGDADWVLADADRYRVSQARAVEFDAATFDAGARALLASLRVGTPLPPAADTVLSLYRGEFLEHERGRRLGTTRAATTRPR